MTSTVAFDSDRLFCCFIVEFLKAVAAFGTYGDVAGQVAMFLNKKFVIQHIRSRYARAEKVHEQPKFRPGPKVALV